MLDIKNVKLKTEEEIMSSWIDTKKLVVSIVCTTFNHELYIEDAITGFLMQETDFAFEIIIHDDASTDKTTNIIKKYQNQYPKIIKPIFQIENQYSKGGFKPSFFAMQQAQGAYITLCEGDDYWIDSKKLSKHIKFFRENSEYALHVFDSYEEYEGSVNENSSKLKRLSIKPGEYSCSDMKYRFCLLPLSSCFLNNFKFPLPSYFKKSINGDTLINILLSSKGKAYVDNSQKVAVYRIHEGGVWSAVSSELKFYESMHNFLVHARFFNDEKDINEKIMKNLTIFMINRIGKLKVISIFFMMAIRKLKRLLLVD
ncbi:glycosyltransferase [Thalassotalea sp. HSM 43]|uniref:glycosyltransferase n=1 Tax=Thalassotalea sp. HSM 43 TaxID=2552945 RepID=UPI001080F556|nr:glycosyltransferase [Thalassotalea sp. HSM 43]QBY03131.1 glycosyltransferase [Thalassotalea sp. HSM 43]